jgi:hypothetical protein
MLGVFSAIDCRFKRPPEKRVALRVASLRPRYRASVCDEAGQAERQHERFSLPAEPLSGRAHHLVRDETGVLLGISKNLTETLSTFATLASIQFCLLTSAYVVNLMDGLHDDEGRQLDGEGTFARASGNGEGVP